MFLIRYDHLGAARYGEWRVKKLLDNLICNPLEVIQDFGALGVAIFFLISGFLAYNSQEHKVHKMSESLLKKLKRLFIPLLGGMIICFAVLKVYEKFFGNTYWSGFSIKEWLECTLLINYVKGTPNVINGVLWYLVPLIVFYILINTIQTFIKNDVFFILIYGIILIVIIGLFPNFNSLTPFAYMPLFGTIVYLFFEKDWRFTKTIFSLRYIYCLMVLSFKMFLPGYYSGNNYLVSFIYGFLLFSICVSIESRFKKPVAIIDFFSKISYSFYIMHSIIGGFAMTILEMKGINFSVCFVVGVTVSVVASYINWNLFENKLFKLLNRRKNNERN